MTKVVYVFLVALFLLLTGCSLAPINKEDVELAKKFYENKNMLFVEPGSNGLVVLGVNYPKEEKPYVLEREALKAHKPNSEILSPALLERVFYIHGITDNLKLTDVQLKNLINQLILTLNEYGQATLAYGIKELSDLAEYHYPAPFSTNGCQDLKDYKEAIVRNTNNFKDYYIFELDYINKELDGVGDIHCVNGGALRARA